LAAARFFPAWTAAATHCRARLRDSSGRELRHCVGAASNIYIDFDAAMRVVRETINSAIAAGPGEARDRGRGLGLAGVSEDMEAERVAAALPRFCARSSWSMIAGRGLRRLPMAFGDVGLIIAGTGSAGYRACWSHDNHHRRGPRLQARRRRIRRAPRRSGAARNAARPRLASSR